MSKKCKCGAVRITGTKVCTSRDCTNGTGYCDVLGCFKKLYKTYVLCQHHIDAFHRFGNGDYEFWISQFEN